MKKLILLLLCFILGCKKHDHPAGFSKVEDVKPPILIDIRYSGTDNFLGRPVIGYENPKNVLTNETINALVKIQKALLKDGLSLKLFDGYRPQKSVNDFVEWSKNLTDTMTKNKYYPNEKKENLFIKGYIAEKSSHSRGSTVDVTLVYTDSINYGKELDMGSCWDYFGNKSWYDYDSLSDIQKYNRNYLKITMVQNGFKPYSKEWWHFTLIDEPFDQTYFDF